MWKTRSPSSDQITHGNGWSPHPSKYNSKGAIRVEGQAAGMEEGVEEMAEVEAGMEDKEVGIGQEGEGGEGGGEEEGVVRQGEMHDTHALRRW